MKLSVLDQSPSRRARPGRRRCATRSTSHGSPSRSATAATGSPSTRDRMLAGASPEVLLAAIARGDDAHAHRQRRGDAAALQPAQGGGDLQRPLRPVRRPHRPRRRQRTRNRSGDDSRCSATVARRPDDFPEQLAELMAYLDASFPRGTRSPASSALRQARVADAVAARIVAPERDLGGRARLAVLVRRLHQSGGRGDRTALPRPLRAVARATGPRAGDRGVDHLRRDRRRGRAPRRRARAWRSPCCGGVGLGRFRRSTRRSSSSRSGAVGALAERPPAGRGVAGDACASDSRRSPPSTTPGRCAVVTITYDHAARRRSYELIASAFGL